MKNNLLIVLLAILIWQMFSCTKEDKEVTKGEFGHGVFITNEGPFQNGTGTITYYDRDSGTVKQDIFRAVNDRPLGNIVQSMTLHNGKAFIVVNNAAKIEMADAATFKSEGSITGLTLPRFILPINESKAYVSQWNGKVAIIDLQSNSITDSVVVGLGPESMVRSGKYVFVANSGGFGYDNTVSVLDAGRDQVVKTIVAGDLPTALIADGNGGIWVFCRGKGFNGWPAADDTPGSIGYINPVTLTYENKFTFSSASDHPEKPVLDETTDNAYFLTGEGVFKVKLGIEPLKPVRFAGRNFYALGFDASQHLLYASDPRDYMHNGWVLRYNANTGELRDSIRAGIIPGGFAFSE